MDAENNIENAEPRMIEFKCPACHELTSFPEMDAGLLQDCPFCTEVLVVPTESCEVGGGFPVPIKTFRLVLRRFSMGDLDDLIRIMTSEDQSPYDNLYPAEEAGVERWLNAQGGMPFAQGQTYLTLAIEVLESEKLIGVASFQYLDHTRRQAQITVLISTLEQRKGYGLEAINGLLDFGFRGIGLRRMTSLCDERNAAFLALAAKAGFRQEGAFIEDRFMGAEWVNTAYFAMLAEDYRKAEKG